MPDREYVASDGTRVSVYGAQETPTESCPACKGLTAQRDELMEALNVLMRGNTIHKDSGVRKTIAALIAKVTAAIRKAEGSDGCTAR